VYCRRSNYCVDGQDKPASVRTKASVTTREKRVYKRWLHESDRTSTQQTRSSCWTIVVQPAVMCWYCSPTPFSITLINYIHRIVLGEVVMSIDNRQFFVNQLIWIGISLGISLAISIILPFPVSLVVIISVFILLSTYLRKIMIRRIGAGKGLGILNPGIGSGKVKYYCMSCETQHNQLACPRCGSKMKRVGT